MSPATATAIAREVAKIYGKTALPKIVIRQSSYRKSTSGHCWYGDKRVWARTTAACSSCRAHRRSSAVSSLHHRMCWRRAERPGSFERARIVITCGYDTVDQVATLVHELAHALTPGADHNIIFVKKHRELCDLFEVTPRGGLGSKRAVRQYERRAAQEAQS